MFRMLFDKVMFYTQEPKVVSKTEKDFMKKHDNEASNTTKQRSNNMVTIEIKDDGSRVWHNL